MSRTIRITILFLALELLWLSAGASAQVPLISQISPQPTPAGTPTSSILITGSNFGQPTDTVRFPGNPVQYVTPTTWASGYLIVPVPSTWSGSISVFSAMPGPDEPFEVSYNWGGEKWGASSMTWLLNQNGAPGVPIGSVIGATTWAYDTWECASGFAPSYGGTTANDGSNHSDGYNVQYWSTNPWADPNLIAVATYTYNTSTHVIYEADIHYNGADWSWSIGGSSTSVDIQHIATHESGHTLGLMDLYGTADAEKTMYGFGGNDETFARSLHEHDYQGAEYLYPHAGRGNSVAGTPPGWAFPIVPRMDADATDSWAPLPSMLLGYWPMFANFSETNNGLDCLAPGARKFLYLDELTFNNGGWYGSLAPGQFYSLKNQPVTVPGGRHTLRVDHDKYNGLIESNENDNTYKAQFVWSPFGLADQHPEVRPAPPARGTLTYANCEGFMFTGNWWGAVAVTPTDSSDDYDVFLFNDYTGSTGGYQTQEAASARLHGNTDFVLMNGNIVGNAETRWAGTVRSTAAAGADAVVQQSNQVGETYYPGYLYGSSATTGPRILAPNQIIKVHEFYLADPSVTYEFDLMISAGAADLDVAVFDAQIDYHGLSDAVAFGQTGGPGERETIQYKPSVSGYYGVAVYKYGSSDLPIDATYELICRVAPPNLDATDVPSGHDSPLVPRNVPGASSGNVHLTTVLDGNSPTTLVSYAVEQEGPNDSPEWMTWVTLDDEVVLDVAGSGEPVPTTSVQWFDRGPFEVRGGRHSLALLADPDDLVTEASELDNVWQAQFAWSPLAVGFSAPVVRDAPPTTGLVPYLNCDGMSFARSPGYAWVVGMTPLHPEDDYELLLYEDYLDSQDGFDSHLAYSYAFGGETEFVVGHYLQTPIDVITGVVHAGATAREPFALQATDARDRQESIDAELLFQHMDPFHMVDVYEVNLEIGDRVLFKLEDFSEQTDMKMYLFPGTAGGIYTVSNPHEVSTTFTANEEWMIYEAVDDGWHPLVVCRTDYRGLDQPLEYNLVWHPTAITGVEEETTAPTKLMFAAPAPNPTSNGATLGFALPRAGHVMIDVFDLRGRRVQTVIDRHLQAGPHQVRWTGRDDRGRQAATGVYYARLRFADQLLTRRMTVLR